MRNKILSLGIACGVMLGAWVVYHVVNNGSENQAFAAAGINGAGVIDDARKEDGRTALRRSIAHNSDEIINLTGQHLRSVLQEPGLVRRDSPITIWQYRNSSCVLDVYFKTTKSDASFAPVAHYEMRARETGASNQDVSATCLPSLLRDKHAFKMVGVNSFYKALSE